MQVWKVLHTARCKYRTQKSRQKSPCGHHPRNLLGYIFATKACIDNLKKNLLSSNISSTCPHNMVNFSPLAAEIISLVWGTPGNFNRFCVLAALLHSTLVVGVSQTAALNRGRHLYSAGRPSRWALAHISSILVCFDVLFHWFLPQDAMLPQYMLSYCVRLSVRLSSRSQCPTKTAEYRITQTASHDTPGTLVFWRQISWRKSSTFH